ncbi:3-oxoacyl-[acyl-carrier protein] reductase [Actinopolymorpha cephalotaxi]|uniref:3-oxoacyl-[acyl-carrier protein] reductase n=1 Tax=Actinopolymorpha cephalotaxi TaxID=504797 RepID=A0A1I2XT56_9ACTN|nr:SDR family oxidoreductase [Actinopolymorpha cephalotaxi]NYH87173.1 3-oxoacyl-[acyl-carrier protein] reductase [Actinopolymorpha cephalotaxi]SFH16630.1 3-oxoacyl-[acyl-carrier protein] reductase [Actinopolymorpha cephalotaxi]
MGAEPTEVEPEDAELIGAVLAGAELTGKGAVVTGGSRGIGRAIVERLALDGAEVVFSYRSDEAAATEVVAKVAAAGGVAHAVRMDLVDPDQVRALFAEAERLLTRLDIVVHNAVAVQVSERATLARTRDDDFDVMVTANIRGAFVVLQEASRRVRDGGRIITISSLNTQVPVAGNGLYQAAKGAVELLTITASKELGGRGITANIVSPGATDTDLLHASNPPEALAAIPKMTALGRLGTPDDIANVVGFLARSESGWLTGQNIRATGGLP